MPSAISLKRASTIAEIRKYAIQKRYMSVESMAMVSENPAIRLPAAPALA